MSKEQEKHDSIVEKLKDIIVAKGYDEKDIFTNVNYKNQKQGEIDLYVGTDKYILLFEVKVNKKEDTYRKALDQLARAKKHYFLDNPDVFCFVVHDCNKDCEHPTDLDAEHKYGSLIIERVLRERNNEENIEQNNTE